MDTRSAEDVVSGVLRIAVGGETKIVPTLSIRATREWQQHIGAPTGRFRPADANEWTAGEASDFANLTLDTLLDIVIAYDTTSALGGREWLEDHADPFQIYTAAEQMASVAFPFADDPRLLMASLIAQAVVGSTLPSSTNGHSRTGASTRARSKTASTRAS